MDVEVQCPCCGEALVLRVDRGQSRRFEYVEDCEVCCRPMQVRGRTTDEGEHEIEVRRLDD
jgi:predicted RNA-binding Zn-ribbon protein involved in translation (DUF1610 family)